MAFKINKLYQSSKTFKKVRYNDPKFKPLSDGLAVYDGKLYGTKENLQYYPKTIRLVK